MFKGRSGMQKSGDALPGTIDTLIGAGCTLEGQLKSAGSIRIDGTFEGTLTVDGDVIIGESGKVSANVRARNLVIAGEIHGDVEVGNRLELQSTGKLYGKAQMAVVVLEEGAILEGECRMLGTSSGRSAETRATPPLRSTGELAGESRNRETERVSSLSMGATIKASGDGKVSNPGKGTTEDSSGAAGK